MSVEMAQLRLPAASSWKSVQDTHPLTKECLQQATKIAMRIQEDHRSLLDRFYSWGEEKQFSAVLGGVMGGGAYAAVAIETLHSASPYFVGISTAAAFQHASGAHSARIFRANENRKLLEEKIPLIKEELDKSNLNASTKDKILSVFDKSVRLLRIIEARETSLAAGKGFTALSAFVWMASSAFQVPYLPILSILAGTGSLLLASREDGFIREISPSAVASEIQAEIAHLA